MDAGLGLTRCEVLGFSCFVGGLDTAVEAVLKRASSRNGGYACLGNVHVLVSALHDEQLRQALDEAWAVFPDGAPVAWMQRRRGARAAQRVAGPDLMPGVIEAGLLRGARHFLLGSNEATLDSLRKSLEERHAGISIAGLYSPSRSAIEGDDPQIVEAALASNPEIVWCAFGAPRQELWMARHAKELAPALVLGVGASFDFLAGTKPRAPRWMQEDGLEWLHRLLSEPRRLAGRYVRTNSEFIVRALAELGGLRYR